MTENKVVKQIARFAEMRAFNGSRHDPKVVGRTLKKRYVARHPGTDTEKSKITLIEPSADIFALKRCQSGFSTCYPLKIQGHGSLASWLAKLARYCGEDSHE